MTRYVDHATQGTALGRCVVLPGRQYTPDSPLLFFATQAALMRGWDVRHVWWDAPERGSGGDEIAWVADHLDAAVGDYPGPVLVVGKSLGTLAAARAADRGYAAAWFTPLLIDPEVAAPLLTYPAAQLVAIGESDHCFSRSVYDALPGTRVLVAGDHVLIVPGDPVAMVESHREVVRALDAWLATLHP